MVFAISHVYEAFKRQPHKRVNHTQIICCQQPRIFLSVFDHFAGLALKVDCGSQYKIDNRSDKAMKAGQIKKSSKQSKILFDWKSWNNMLFFKFHLKSWKTFLN